MKDSKLKTPVSREVDTYDEDQYDELLDQDGPVRVAGLEFNPSQILKELDPTAYRCGFNDLNETETKWECPICEELHDEESEALECCQDVWECPDCGTNHASEEDADECCADDDDEDDD